MSPEDPRGIIELGNINIKCLIFKIKNNNESEILSTSVTLSEGIHNGMVVNLTKASNAIRSCISAAEKKARILLKKINVVFEEPEFLPTKLSKHKKIAYKIAEKSITLIKNEQNIIPFNPNNYKNVTHILLSTDNDLRTRLKSFARDIDYIHGNVQKIYVNDPLTDLGMQDILNKSRKSDVIIVSMLIRISMDKGLSTIHTTHNQLLSKIYKTGIPIIGISFGSPYLPKYNYMDAYLCTYGYGSISIDATTDALFGRKTITGKLPVDLNEKYKTGYGLVVKKNENFFKSKLNLDLPESFSIINNAILDGVFPGSQLFVSKGNQILVSKSFGNYTYDEKSPKVSNQSIYDVASLTKVL